LAHQQNVENNQLYVVRFGKAEINPIAEKVWQKKYKEHLRMASIGANQSAKMGRRKIEGL
jgi:hypothetical protein